MLYCTASSFELQILVPKINYSFIPQYIPELHLRPSEASSIYNYQFCRQKSHQMPTKLYDSVHCASFWLGFWELQLLANSTIVPLTSHKPMQLWIRLTPFLTIKEPAKHSGAERSRAQRSGAEQSGAEQSGAEQSGAEQSGAEQSGAERSRAEQSGAERSRAEQSGAERSRAERSGAEH